MWKDEGSQRICPVLFVCYFSIRARGCRLGQIKIRTNIRCKMSAVGYVLWLRFYRVGSCEKIVIMSYQEARDLCKDGMTIILRVQVLGVTTRLSISCVRKYESLVHTGQQSLSIFWTGKVEILENMRRGSFHEIHFYSKVLLSAYDVFVLQHSRYLQTWEEWMQVPSSGVQA